MYLLALDSIKPVKTNFLNRFLIQKTVIGIF